MLHVFCSEPCYYVTAPDTIVALTSCWTSEVSAYSLGAWTISALEVRSYYCASGTHTRPVTRSKEPINIEGLIFHLLPIIFLVTGSCHDSHTMFTCVLFKEAVAYYAEDAVSFLPTYSEPGSITASQEGSITKI